MFVRTWSSRDTGPHKCRGPAREATHTPRLYSSARTEPRQHWREQNTNIDHLVSAVTSSVYSFLDTYFCLDSRDQPSRGPAVALTPPLLNSISAASSRLKEVEWLLFNLQEKHISSHVCPLMLKHSEHTAWILPAEEFPEAFRLLFGFRWGRQRSSIMWFTWRDAGQVQMLCAFTFCLSCKHNHKHINMTRHVSDQLQNYSSTSTEAPVQPDVSLILQLTPLMQKNFNHYDHFLIQSEWEKIHKYHKTASLQMV